MSRLKLDATTRLTARAMLYFAHDWHLGHLVPADAAALYARCLYSYSPKLARRLGRQHSAWFRQILSAVEYVTMPGVMLHYVVRKLALEELVRSGIDAGAAQVVVLVAGFDSLAARLHRQFPRVRFIEVDRPDMQVIKRRALTGKWAPGINFSFVGAERGYPALEQKLINSSFASGVPTLFVVEDLLAFVDASERDALFDFFKVLGGSGSRVLFTAIERDDDGRVRFGSATWLARLWQRLRSARFRWTPSRDELQEYLSTRGFTRQALLTSSDLRVRYLDGNPDIPLADGEDIVVAQANPTAKSR